MSEDRSSECARYIDRFIKKIGSAELALEAINNTPVPNKYRKGKKLLRKMIRLCIYAQGKEKK